MSIHIGLMIWKEMKQQQMSVAALSESLEISKNKLQIILNSKSIETELLLNICVKLNFNFFGIYENDALIKKLKSQSNQEADSEIERLKSLIIEKNKVIELKDQLLKTQTQINVLMERRDYR